MDAILNEKRIHLAHVIKYKQVLLRVIGKIDKIPGGIDRLILSFVGSSSFNMKQ